jgi:hypothetical protein
MTGIGSFKGLPIEDPDALQDVEVPMPELRPHDVLVRVQAVSVSTRPTSSAEVHCRRRRHRPFSVSTPQA